MPKTRAGKIIVFSTIGLFLVIVIALVAAPSSDDGSSQAQAATDQAPSRTTTSPATATAAASSPSNSGSSSSSQAATDQASARTTTSSVATTATASSPSSDGSSQSPNATESASADQEEPDSSGEDVAQDERPEPTIAETPAPEPIGVSGSGHDVQTIDLVAGIWFCDVSVSGNDDEYGPGYFSVEFTGRDGSYDLLANEIETNWSARKRVSVGGGFLDDFSPGLIDVEVEASGVWRIECEAQTTASSASASSRAPSAAAGSSTADESRFTGSGDSVATMELGAGVWFCEVSVEDNTDPYGPSNFVVELTGRNGGYDLLANEIEADWSALKRVSVGDGFLDFGEGLIDVEVTAEGFWEISCVRQ